MYHDVVSFFIVWGYFCSDLFNKWIAMFVSKVLFYILRLFCLDNKR
ncbi:hypothetical protein CSC12_5447 [Klebsiella michiganensis]|nr:hypothetical protein CSC12_5447 [Klebsiella michiganensis]